MRLYIRRISLASGNINISSVETSVAKNLHRLVILQSDANTAKDRKLWPYVKNFENVLEQFFVLPVRSSNRTCSAGPVVATWREFTK